jgi:hypothetical protein
MLWLYRFIVALTLLSHTIALHNEGTYGIGISLSSDYGWGFYSYVSEIHELTLRLQNCKCLSSQW